MFKIKFTGKKKGPPQGPSGEEWSSLGEEGAVDSKGKAASPQEFQEPAAFRTKLEYRGPLASRMPLPAFVAYPALVGAMMYWCYFCYRYNQIHFPASVPRILLFFGVVIVLTVVMLMFHEAHLRVRMAPVLRRLASSRPGAFIAMEGNSPVLLYARDRWIGKTDFREGDKHQDAFTRLDARLREPAGQLEIRRKTFFDRIARTPDKCVVRLPESEFSREFVATSPEGSAGRFLTSGVMDAILRLRSLGNPVVCVNRDFVRVEVEKQLFKPREEASLKRFLCDAEIILGTASGESGGAGSSLVSSLTDEEKRIHPLKKLVYAAAAVMVLVGGGFSFAEWQFHREFVRRAEELKGLAGPQDPAFITARDLSRLPEPARKYLSFAGVEGKKRIRTVHVRGTGSIKNASGESWRSFEGDSYFTVPKPSFCGYVKVRFRSVLHFAFYDSYSEGNARRVTRFLSLLERPDVEGEGLARALFLRFLTDLPLYPTVLLDDTRVSWGKSDATSAELILKDGSLEWPARLFFDPKGSLARMELIRPFGPGKNAEQRKWTGTYGDYEDFGGFKLPTRFESAWNLTTGDVTFARFNSRTVRFED